MKGKPFGVSEQTRLLLFFASFEQILLGVLLLPRWQRRRPRLLSLSLLPYSAAQPCHAAQASACSRPLVRFSFLSAPPALTH
jgi:hypothetical protein